MDLTTTENTEYWIYLPKSIKYIVNALNTIFGI